MKLSGGGSPASILVRNTKLLKQDRVELSDCFVGLVHLPRGEIDIGELILTGIGGDSMNLRNGNVRIKRLIARGSTAWVEYEAYHQDICQATAVEEDGHTVDWNAVVSDVEIPYVDIEVYGEKHQVFMNSDGGFDNWHIGTEYLRIRCAYKYWFVSNTLSRSFLGNLGGVDIKCIEPTPDGNPPKDGRLVTTGRAPLVRIGDGIEGSEHCIKVSPHRTENVMVIGCGRVNEVPPNVMQF